MANSVIGLDIGSFAVRAAELSVDDKDRRELRRFGQVTLPEGAVIDGEIVDRAAVVQALRQLWSEGGFTSKKVVVGVSGQRVLIRQADMTPMSDDELRSAIHYEAQELIPMPVSSVYLDSQIVEESRPDSADGSASMRILLAAGHRGIVEAAISACREASLEPVAVDIVALALMRAVPPLPPQEDGRAAIDAVVSIGADLTVVAIRENAITRFVRVLSTGGSDLTAAIAQALSVESDDAEDLKRQVVNGDGGGHSSIALARDAVSDRIDNLVDEICGSIDFYRAQARIGAVGRVLVTGGATRTSELVERLSDALGLDVATVDPYQWLTTKGRGLTSPQLAAAAPYLVTPVGLALWASPSEQRRISLLPTTIDADRRHRQGIAVVAASLAVTVAALGGLWTIRHNKLHSVQDQVASANSQSVALREQVSTLGPGLRLQTEVQAKQALVAAALSQNTDWIRLFGQIAAVIPADVTIESFSGQGTSPMAASSSSATGSTRTVSISGTAMGGAPSVAEWIRDLGKIPALSGIWVSSVTSSTGPSGSSNRVEFSSSATLTKAADTDRLAQFTGGAK